MLSKVSYVSSVLLYHGLLRAKQDQAEKKLNRTYGLPFMQTNPIFSPHTGVGNNPEKLAYCLGLNRTQLPGPLSVASINSGLLSPKKLPIIGKNSPGLETFHHTGNMPGFLASTFLVPSTQSAVIVLINALPLIDPTDLVGQVILSVFIGEELPNKFIALAKTARSQRIKCLCST